MGGEKNRIQKILEDCGIKLGCVVSDINGVSAKRMIVALIEGRLLPEEMVKLCVSRLQKKEEEIKLALDGSISDRHRFLLRRIMGHIEWLERQIEEIDSQVVNAMRPYIKEWEILQTLPGVDEISARCCGVDMSRFGSKERLSSWAGMSPGNNESAGKKERTYDKGKLLRPTDTVRDSQQRHKDGLSVYGILQRPCDQAGSQEGNNSCWS